MIDAIDDNVDHGETREGELARTCEARVSDLVRTGRAAWTYTRETADRLYDYIPLTSRRRWGQLSELVLNRWDELDKMRAARALVEELIDEAVSAGEKRKSHVTGLIGIAAGLVCAGILRRAIDRRVRELEAEEVGPDPATATGSGLPAGGGQQAA